MKQWCMALAIVVMVSGCGKSLTSDPDLQKWVKSVQERKPSNTPDPLLSVEDTAVFSYKEHMTDANGQALRNPFAVPVDINQKTASVRPDPNRPRQPLEAYPLDSLKMVGTMGAGTALIMAPDKIVHRVGPGVYMGQQDGRVLQVFPQKVVLVELVSDGSGGWKEQEASITLE